MMSPPGKERTPEATSVGIWHDGGGHGPGPWGPSCTDVSRKMENVLDAFSLPFPPDALPPHHPLCPRRPTHTGLASGGRVGLPSRR